MLGDSRRALHIDGIDIFTWCSSRGLAPVRFAPNQRVVTPSQEKQLDRLRDAVDRVCLGRDKPICLRGTADRSERDADRLARARAEAVAHWLIDHGVAKDRIGTMSFGARHPIVPPSAPDHGPNRRVEIATTGACPH